MPEIVDICRSIGAATAIAMFSALAPGKVAVTVMDGKSLPEVPQRQARLAADKILDRGCGRAPQSISGTAADGGHT
jgi:hypothetical protein